MASCHLEQWGMVQWTTPRRGEGKCSAVPSNVVCQPDKESHDIVAADSSWGVDSVASRRSLASLIHSQQAPIHSFSLGSLDLCFLYNDFYSSFCCLDAYPTNKHMHQTKKMNRHSTLDVGKFTTYMKDTAAVQLHKHAQLTNRQMQTRGNALHSKASVHLYSLCQTWLTLKTHTVSETENRTSCLTAVSQTITVSSCQ